MRREEGGVPLIFPKGVVSVTDHSMFWFWLIGCAGSGERRALPFDRDRSVRGNSFAQEKKG